MQAELVIAELARQGKTTGRMRWERFYDVCEGKKVFLVGGGKGCVEFLKIHGEKQKIEAIMDNQPEKQGKRLKDFFEDIAYDFDILPVLPEDKEAVYLVTAVRGYKELMEQMRDLGCKSVYSYYELEAREDDVRERAKRERMKQTTCGRKKILRGKWSKPVQKRKLLFNSFNGYYSDHGKYITEKILELKEDFDIVWLLSSMDTIVPDGVRKVNINDIDAASDELATAQVWLMNNADLPEWFVKRKEQIFIQLKHWTGITLKKFYLDDPHISRNEAKVAEWKRIGRMTDFIFTGSKFDSLSCRRGFCPKGKCVELGSARTDAVFQNRDALENVRSYFSLGKEENLILYVPTYRFRWENNKYMFIAKDMELDYKAVLDAAKRRFGGQWKMLVRLHPGFERASEEWKWNDSILNATRYPDAQELLCSCQICISDYSSIMFEPAYVGKPVFLYAPDLDEYLEKDYEMLLDIKELPFGLAGTNQELVDCIERFDSIKYAENLSNFLNKFDVKEDGHACERIVNFLKKICDEM